MKAHSRRAMDVILRLSKSTIDFLSFYKDFGSYCMVKVFVFDERMTFVCFFTEAYVFKFAFDLGIIWGRFRHRESIFLIETLL